MPTARTTDDSGLGRAFDHLAMRRSAALTGLGADGIATLETLGVQVREDRAWLEEDVELLSEVAVRDGLAPATTAWMRDLEFRPHIDSTNSALLARAAGSRIAGCVLAAEVQTAGRGRRGRTWHSPFGRNLAVSIGMAIERPVAELGALSLAVGVAVRRALLDSGLRSVELKWPNDVLLDGRKVAGILIELVRAVPPLEVVVGIGVNVGCAGRVAAHIDQSIADVAEQIARPSRNELLTRILDHVVMACRQFDEAGLAAVRDEWNDAHRYRGVRVVATPAAAGGGTAGSAPAALAGTVLDVGSAGELRIETLQGTRSFTGGEVTLRADAGDLQTPRRSSGGTAAVRWTQTAT